ncbi:hypothetical protein OG455_00485 [Kitasatospora sp. NBC_01287]|uniref:hypothetical protein n=1 Tax=Kitasatospora sp. NBC_01287 TaxID=2903573 RepID=UPI00224E81FE|nr:hypothetical protein [Kitasatospora sp. NBC_01287]MCX4744002.1 hypothetical protein [Kitasatospora sp. NBC_01287]
MLDSLTRPCGEASPSSVPPASDGTCTASGPALRVKCMGRTYAVVATGDHIAVSDVTDITRPLPLGSAVPAGSGLWDIHTPDGRALLRTDELLRALVALRAVYTSSARR